MNTPIPVPIDVDAEVSRLAALPALDQRKAFFATLEALPVHSIARLQLGQVVPRALPKTCGGPWYEHEFNTLAGFTYPKRVHTPEEIARMSDHAEAMQVVERHRAAVIEANTATRRQRFEAERWSTFSNTHNPAKFEAARVTLGELVELERQAREDLELAMHNEVLLRYHQPERKRAAGRNWLRFIRRGAS